MALQIGRFSFHGPFQNLDTLKDRPGIFMIHEGTTKITPIVVKETPLLKSEINNYLIKEKLNLGESENRYVSVYNTYCALSSDREEMIQEIKNHFELSRE